MDVAGIGTFSACLDVNIFFLRKGAEGKVSALYPHNSPSYSFTLTSDGTEQWTDESLGDHSHSVPGVGLVAEQLIYSGSNGRKGTSG